MDAYYCAKNAIICSLGLSLFASTCRFVVAQSIKSLQPVPQGLLNNLKDFAVLEKFRV